MIWRSRPIVFCSISFLFLQAEWSIVWAAVTGLTKSCSKQRLNSWTAFLVKVSGHNLERVCLVFSPSSFFLSTNAIHEKTRVFLFRGFFCMYFKARVEFCFLSSAKRRDWIVRSKTRVFCQTDFQEFPPRTHPRVSVVKQAVVESKYLASWLIKEDFHAYFGAFVLKKSQKIYEACSGGFFWDNINNYCKLWKQMLKIVKMFKAFINFFPQQLMVLQFIASKIYFYCIQQL